MPQGQGQGERQGGQGNPPPPLIFHTYYNYGPCRHPAAAAATYIINFSSCFPPVSQLQNRQTLLTKTTNHTLPMFTQRELCIRKKKLDISHARDSSQYHMALATCAQLVVCVHMHVVCLILSRHAATRYDNGGPLPHGGTEVRKCMYVYIQE